MEDFKPFLKGFTFLTSWVYSSLLKCISFYINESSTSALKWFIFEKKVNSKVLPLSHNNLIHIKSNYIKTAIHPVLYIKKLRYIMGNGCQRFCKDTFIWWHMYTKLLHPNLNNIMHIYRLSYDECLLSWYTYLCLIWFNWKGFYETVLKVDESNTSE